MADPGLHLLKCRLPRTESPLWIFTNHHSPVTNHQILTGTRERLKTRATHRKQTTVTHSNRYESRRRSRFPLHCFTLMNEVFTRANQPPRLSTNHHSPVTTQQPLPDTVSRVETHLSHRKQTMATGSTRHSARGTLLRVPFAVRASSLQLLASRTLACIRAAGVTSVSQREQQTARTYTSNALGATPTATERPSGTPQGGGCYEPT